MPYTEINVTMELVSSFVVAILIFSQLRKKKKCIQDWLFLSMLGIHMVCTLSDTVNWAFDTWQGEPYRMLTMTGNFLSYFMSSFAYIAYIPYITITASGRKQKDRRILWVVCMISALMAVTSVLNLFNGMLYHIDENNYFYWGNWDWLFNCFVFAQLVLGFLQILQCRDMLEKRETIYLLSYEVLPIIAILFSLITVELTLIYPATMLSLLLLYINVQQEQENKLARQELELMESHTAIMISQIQPHFLFNALTAVENLCGTDPIQAQKSIADFSKYLRGNMQALAQKRPIPFSDELMHIRHYLNLEQVRFGDRLRVVMEIGPTDFFVPALSVQPIVENAVKHGVTCRKLGGTVTLRTEERPNTWEVVITDDGIGFDPEACNLDREEHIGIANVRSRLALIVGGTLDIRSALGKGTTVVLRIPKEEVR